VTLSGVFFTGHSLEFSSLDTLLESSLLDPLESSSLKRPVRDADNSPPSSAEVKNARSYTYPPPIRLPGLCLVKHRDNFPLPYLTFLGLIITQHPFCFVPSVLPFGCCLKVILVLVTVLFPFWLLIVPLNLRRFYIIIRASRKVSERCHCCDKLLTNQ